MGMFFQFIMMIVELACFWRLAVCVGPALFITGLLHAAYPESGWIWFITAPMVIAAVALAFWWDWRSDQETKRQD